MANKFVFKKLKKKAKPSKRAGSGYMGRMAFNKQSRFGLQGVPGMTHFKYPSSRPHSNSNEGSDSTQEYYRSTQQGYQEWATNSPNPHYSTGHVAHLEERNTQSKNRPNYFSKNSFRSNMYAQRKPSNRWRALAQK
jgi:hypothetical protein